MLDQLVLAAQLAIENVDSKEMKAVLSNVYSRNFSHQAEQANSLVDGESVNSLVVKKS